MDQKHTDRDRTIAPSLAHLPLPRKSQSLASAFYLFIYLFITNEAAETQANTLDLT